MLDYSHLFYELILRKKGKKVTIEALNKTKILKIYFMLFALSLISILDACRLPSNYEDEKGPLYISNLHAKSDSIEIKEHLTVVSFNIEKGEKIKETVALFEKQEELSSVDIILLQEMDANGTEELAEAFQMNFVYYPINNEYSSKRDFGNAILSRDSIWNEKKIILPHGQFHNARKRSATIATTLFQGHEIRIASVHLATVMMTSPKRFAQVQALTENISAHSRAEDKYIIGGDFNAVTAAYRNKITHSFKSKDFDYASQGLGSTHRGHLKYIKPELDMVFSKNLEIIDIGKIADNSASDHFPIWVKFKI